MNSFRFREARRRRLLAQGRPDVWQSADVTLPEEDTNAHMWVPMVCLTIVGVSLSVLLALVGIALGSQQ